MSVYFQFREPTTCQLVRVSVSETLNIFIECGHLNFVFYRNITGHISLLQGTASLYLKMHQMKILLTFF